MVIISADIEKEGSKTMLRFAVNNLCELRPPLLRSLSTTQYNVQLSNVSTNTKSKTNTNPQNLPHQPVPKLEDTMMKYLKTVRPHVTDEEYLKTTNIVKQFMDQEGQDLQKILVNKAKTEESWLAKWWLNAAYLDFRSTVVVHSSPGLIFPFQKFYDTSDALRYTAKLMLGTFDFKQLIDNDKIPVEKMGKDELDMQQYKQVFGTCRIPGIKRDEIQFHPKSNHVIVMYKNNFIKIDPFDEQMRCMNEEQLLEQLNYIVNTFTEKGEPIGILTADNRDNWGKAYEELRNIEGNDEVLDLIHSSMVLVCLDEAMTTFPGESLWSKAGRQLIHAGGSACNAANRWYDKTIQLIVGTDGVVGLTYEHSPAEGVPIAVMTDHFIKHMAANKPMEKRPNVELPELLTLCTNENVKQYIEVAKNNLDELVHDFEMENFKFSHYGKETIKKFKVSPDSYIQMALQLAFYRLHETPGAHYESAATRKYVHGRTETIRSCSIESIKFAKAMMDKSKSNQEKEVLLREAIKAHKEYTVAALNGFGVDRHLLGLKLSAIENGYEIPEIFNDVGFQRSAHMRISTSQVAVKCDGLMAYGPLVPNGYGCCYNPRPNDINFGVSAFYSNPETSAAKFKSAITYSLLDMRKVLEGNEKKKAKL